MRKIYCSFSEATKSLRKTMFWRLQKCDNEYLQFKKRPNLVRKKCVK